MSQKGCVFFFFDVKQENQRKELDINGKKVIIIIKIRIITIKIIVNLFNYSPTIVKVTVLLALGPSNSTKNTDCHVPKSSFEFLIGRHSLDESKNDFRCDFALLSILSCW